MLDGGCDSSAAVGIADSRLHQQIESSTGSGSGSGTSIYGLCSVYGPWSMVYTTPEKTKNKRPNIPYPISYYTQYHTIHIWYTQYQILNTSILVRAPYTYLPYTPIPTLPIDWYSYLYHIRYDEGAGSNNGSDEVLLVFGRFFTRINIKKASLPIICSEEKRGDRRLGEVRLSELQSGILLN